eukprot:scaffold18207_cov129-Isochrysis_galbana.AAC.3
MGWCPGVAARPAHKEKQTVRADVRRPPPSATAGATHGIEMGLVLSLRPGARTRQLSVVVHVLFAVVPARVEIEFGRRESVSEDLLQPSHVRCLAPVLKVDVLRERQQDSGRRTCGGEKRRLGDS